MDHKDFEQSFLGGKRGFELFLKFILHGLNVLLRLLGLSLHVDFFLFELDLQGLKLLR